MSNDWLMSGERNGGKYNDDIVLIGITTKGCPQRIDCGLSRWWIFALLTSVLIGCRLKLRLSTP